MKTLNRPMFRYGGPIKEGVMNGIREPKRNGGSMTQRVQPSNDGSRPGYAGPFIPIGMGIAAGARAIAPALVRYGKPLLQGAKRIFGKTTPASVTKGAKFNAREAAKEFGKGSGRARGVTMNESTFAPNYFGRDPIIKSVGAIGKGIFSPTSKGVVAKAARFATAPSSVVAGVAYYMWPDGKERNTPPPGKDQKKGTSGAPGGGNPDMYLTPEGEQTKELTDAEREAATIASRKKQMDMYKEIMDIKGMKKDATYKALIDASQLITAEGDFKGSIKDGSLISKLIGATSKRFDKVSDTETALRSLVAKGEIENVLNKETKAQDREYKQSAIDINKKKLAGTTLAEELSGYRLKQGKNASGKTLAGYVMDEGQEIVSIADSSAVDKHIKSGGDSVSFMELVVANNVKAGKEIIPGMYVVKDSLITINPDGSVSPNYKIT